MLPLSILIFHIIFAALNTKNSEEKIKAQESDEAPHLVYCVTILYTEFYKFCRLAMCANWMERSFQSLRLLVAQKKNVQTVTVCQIVSNI